MKNNFILSWIITIIFSFITKDLNAQATTAGSGNSPANPNVEYLGWTLLTNEVVNVKNEDNLEIHFYTNSGFNTLNNRKMNIGSRSLNSLEHAGVGIQSIGVSPITRLRSILHLGNNSVAGIAGWRAWEDVGTFCGKGSDYAYFGTMTDNYDSTIVAGDNNDAVIVWGDNLFGANDGADHLRIIFNAPMNFSTGTASFYSGLEIARYSPIGRMGIGNFSVTAAGAGSGINPHRRLEIYGENNDALLNAAAPQLRLTHTPNANVDLGINTDFETTSLGDLFINTRSAGAFRNVGINTSTPGATLEINSNFPSTSSQSSGLMFSDLRPTSPNGITSYGKVLTVDAAGLVVLTDDNGGNGSVTACSSLPTDVDFLTKWSTITTGGTREICRTTGVYELPTPPNTVGIGVG